MLANTINQVPPSSCEVGLCFNKAIVVENPIQQTLIRTLSWTAFTFFAEFLYYIALYLLNENDGDR